MVYCLSMLYPGRSPSRSTPQTAELNPLLFLQSTTFLLRNIAPGLLGLGGWGGGGDLSSSGSGVQTGDPKKARILLAVLSFGFY